MSNLKKVISLSLVFVMVFALAISAGAAFKDQDKLQFPDEAALLTELEIIKGDTTGNFNGEGLVTRGQMVKMIYVALNKGIDNGAIQFDGLSVPLKDINGDWAKNYIKYAYSSKIAVGSPSGLFSPAGNITGYEAAKMLLTMLGYKADVEGFVGTGWELNVAVAANDAGLLEGLDTLSLAAKLTRDQAAKMIYNAIIEGYMPTYKDGEIESLSTKFASKKLGLETVEAILLANDTASVDGTAAAKDKIKITRAWNSVAAYDAKTTIQVKGTANVADLGKTVKMYLRTTAALASDKDLSAQEGSITKVYGSPVPTKNNIVQEKSSAITAGAGASAGLKAGFDAAKFTSNLDASVKYVANFAAPAAIGNDGTNNGDMVRYIDNDNDKDIDYVVYIAINYGKVKINNLSSGKTITIGTTLSNVKVGDVKGSELLKTDDRAIYYETKSTDAQDKYVASLATTLVGKVSGVSGADISINGTKYNAAGSFTMEDKYSKEEATFYINGKYIYEATSNAAATIDTYCVVTAVKNGTVSGTWSGDDGVVKYVDEKGVATPDAGVKVAKLYDTAGTEVAVTAYETEFDLKRSTNATGANQAVLCKYSIGSDAKVTLHMVGNLTTGLIGNPAKGSIFDANAGKLSVVSDTVIFVNTGSDMNPKITRVIGSDYMPAYAAGNKAATVKDGSTAKFIYLDNPSTTLVSSTDLYAVVLDSQVVISGDKYAVKFWLFDGKSNKIEEVFAVDSRAEGTSKPDTITAMSSTIGAGKGDVIKFTKSGDKIDMYVKQAVAADASITYAADTVYLGFVAELSGKNVLLKSHDGTNVKEGWFSTDSDTIKSQFKLASGEASYNDDIVTNASEVVADNKNDGDTIIVANNKGLILYIFQRINDDFWTRT